MSRTVSAIQAEANYLRHRIEQTEQDINLLGTDDGALLLPALNYYRAALARCERELGPQGQISIEGIEGAMEFNLL